MEGPAPDSLINYDASLPRYEDTVPATVDGMLDGYA